MGLVAARPEPVGEKPPRRVHVFNTGFLTGRRVRRILQLSGYSPSLGLPGKDGVVAVWGQSPYAFRGEWIARQTGAGLMRVEDAFLRSVLPGRLGGEPPLGLLLDETGVHFDGRSPSDLETLLLTHPLEDPDLLARASAAMARIRRAQLSKYTGFDPKTAPPEPGYVLVVDQTAGDASVRAAGADARTFRTILARARQDHPGNRLVLKPHPETSGGARKGHFGALLPAGVEICDRPVSPWRLLEGATAVYTLSSQLGFEAILAGHRPHVFGQPFYAGWGLSHDHAPLPRRGRQLRTEQLFAAAMILAPKWYDPYRDRLCPLEDALDTLEAETRAWRDDHKGWIAGNMRLWKRPTIQAFFGSTRPVKFTPDAASATAQAAADGRRAMAWGAAPGVVRIEDGFLRSRGLGAELTPALSLVADDLGIYYDPSRESRLDRLIHAACDLPPDARARSERLIVRMTEAGLSKYNLPGAAVPPLPDGHRILVPGQVEDDASIRLGCPAEQRNIELLARCRAENPDAVILYKPHPDVEAGLRPGAIANSEAHTHADMVLPRTALSEVLQQVDEVWTLTSALGFEALLRRIPVTCLGIPFYAGWGLTRDLGPVPAHRKARPDLAALVHAALIDYPRYRDPVTGRPCPVEVVAERLALGRQTPRGRTLHLLAKIQGALASHAFLWRR
ncbi:capsular polysaccharide export protein [Rhodovulum imhoffii]|uniref:Capsular polysaccharide export protein n=1 Tax=Rhodovulum imhoffii TaxID=365340 RepID=A0A2T5BVV2_9RHOB|nr:capsular polysaccharide biosynthesis protein [Rhodovulum imhoffii]MBK5933198.1 beta-3-deoxy-D-manno-oct-2-ulosonic acid transferase [Rhodovulum imhoffii]PTN03701.1 capsular polysaccharide export protein [Rhodovulum imhoffii]